MIQKSCIHNVIIYAIALYHVWVSFSFNMLSGVPQQGAHLEGVQRYHPSVAFERQTKVMASVAASIPVSPNPSPVKGKATRGRFGATLACQHPDT